MNGSMASACVTSRPLVSAPSACPSSKKTAGGARCRRRRTVSCKAGGGGGRGCDDGLLWLPRRDVMLTGLSGVAAGLAWYPGLASGEDSSCTTLDPVHEDLLQCTNTAQQSPCPLVSPTDPVDFKPAAKVTRVRQAAHLLSRENQEKYREAVGKMKALELSDPTNPLRFAAQASIHESYCDHYYNYLKKASPTGDPIFDVHESWLFAPWHRMYIYFYERALGQLIGDDSFALPFWNWDHPAGMGIPEIFKSAYVNVATRNPLYDVNRNPLHIDAMVDLDYNFENHDDSGDEVIVPFKGPRDEKYKELVNKNLCTVYSQQVLGGNGALSFLGEKYCTNMTDKGVSSQGSLERMSHGAVHNWTGKAGPTPSTEKCTLATGGFPSHDQGKYSCNNDMGFLGSAGWDPIFYTHHCNVDRMWHIWSTMLGGGQGFTDADWLDTSFVFYDDVENPRKVRITFRDVLDTRNLGYTYDAESSKDLPWLRCKIVSLVPHGKDAPATTTQRSRAAAPVFPLTLTKGQVVQVPAVAVPAEEPGKETVLVIDGIEFDPLVRNKFDVAINVPADKASKVGPQYNEYAGSFANVPASGAPGGGTRKGKVSLCINRVLSNIEADGDSTVDVVIVPRTTGKVTLNARPTIQIRE